MKQEFNFNQVGKRTPYTITEHFFQDMEEKLWVDISEQSYKKRKKMIHKRILLIVTAVAASVFIFIFNIDTHREVTSKGNLARIDKAFNDLSADDQAYLMDIYQNDLFINDN